MRNTLTKTAIGPENAIALYGLIPIRRASSNCRSINPMRAKARGAPQNSRVPQVGFNVGSPPETQDPIKEEENDP